MKPQSSKEAAEEIEICLKNALAPTPGRVNFRGPNWATAFYFCALLVIAQMGESGIYLKFLPHDIAMPLGSAFVAIGFSRIVRFYGQRIAAFQPRSVIEAKRANEQIKSVSTLFNALAAGGAITLSATQLSGTDPDFALIVLSMGLAVWIHTGSRNLLGFIKDERESAFAIP